MEKVIKDKIKNYTLSLQDIARSNWHYIGSSKKGIRDNYLKMTTPIEAPLPPYQSRCICGHDIIQQCYITNGKDIEVIGNCCRLKWMPKDRRGRTCENCKKPHRNRKDNYCNECRQSPINSSSLPGKSEWTRLKTNPFSPGSLKKERDEQWRQIQERLGKQKKQQEEEERKIRERRDKMTLESGNYKLGFGKYKNCTLEEIYRKSPKYLDNLIENILLNYRSSYGILLEYVNYFLESKS